MDATRLFNCLLFDIENSGLNYLVYKTPFSANISLKSSFSKHFSRNDSFQSESNSSSTCVDQPTKCEGNVVKALKLENLQLKAQVESLEKIVTDQKDIINEQFEQKRNQKISSEEQAAEFRPELIKIKMRRVS